MRLTIEQIMRQIAATVNQEATPPTAGDDEYNLWLEYINRGYFEWVNANDWEALRKNFYPSVIGVNQATVSLPLDYRKLAAEPRLYNGEISQGTPYPEIIPEQAPLYHLDDRYFTIRGDISTGHVLLIHPATLGSGASLEIQYYSMPTSLASPAEIPLVPDSQYLIDRTIAYIFESRSDSRFQLEENKARERLVAMIENANAAKYNSYAGPNFVIGPERKQGFRIGRD